MSRFDEFDGQTPPTPAPAGPVSYVAASFPAAKALVEDLRALCPELFAGAKVVYMAENGQEIKTRKYRAIEQMTAIDAGQWFEIGEASKRNAVFAGRKRR